LVASANNTRDSGMVIPRIRRMGHHSAHTIAGFNDYSSVQTLLVAGTPLWAAAEGVICGIPSEGGKGPPNCRGLIPL